MARIADSMTPAATLPRDGGGALAGRVWRPDVGGPSVVAVRSDGVWDISRLAPTMRDLAEAVRNQRGDMSVRELARPIHVVPETKKIDELLREFQDARVQMALVANSSQQTPVASDWRNVSRTSQVTVVAQVVVFMAWHSHTEA